MIEIGTEMADQDRDWLAHQALASVRWLESLPAGALSPTGVSLCNRANEWLVFSTREAALTVVADPQGKRATSKSQSASSEHDMQPPLMMDLPTPKS